MPDQTSKEFEITSDQLYALLQKKESLLLFDLRLQEIYKEGHVNGSVHAVCDARTKDTLMPKIPKNVKLSPVNRKTGEPSYIGAEDAILEAFRPGTEPKVGALKSVIQMGADDQVSGSTFDFDFAEETSLNGAKVPEKVVDNIEADPAKVDEKLDDGLY